MEKRIITSIKKRSRHELYAQILLICRSGSRKTNIVYKLNSNFSCVNKYLKTLIGLNLIRKSSKYYFLTDEGRKWLIFAEKLGLNDGHSKETHTRELLAAVEGGEQ